MAMRSVRVKGQAFRSSYNSSKWFLIVDLFSLTVIWQYLLLCYPHLCFGLMSLIHKIFL